jgi:ribosomal protein S18 acetylase RimI-like enzyme
MLAVRDYDDGDVFWREVAEPLSVRRVPANVFVGVAYASRSRSDVPRFGVFGDGRLVLGALRTPPFRLNLADFGAGEAAARVLAVHLAERGVRLPGVVGDERLTGAFTDAWVAKTGQLPIEAPGHGRRQNLYRIESVVFPRGVAGHMRSARQSERDLLVRWEQGFADDAQLPPAESDPAFVAGLVDAGLAEGAFSLWEVEGEPRATARLRPIADIGARVSGVYTPPDARGRGYAAALTAALSQAVLARGQFCCLFADAANPLTNRIYQRIGYVKVAGFADVLFPDADG